MVDWASKMNYLFIQMYNYYQQNHAQNVVFVVVNLVSYSVLWDSL